MEKIICSCCNNKYQPRSKYIERKPLCRKCQHMQNKTLTINHDPLVKAILNSTTLSFEVAKIISLKCQKDMYACIMRDYECESPYAKLFLFTRADSEKEIFNMMCNFFNPILKLKNCWKFPKKINVANILASNPMIKKINKSEFPLFVKIIRSRYDEYNYYDTYILSNTNPNPDGDYYVNSREWEFNQMKDIEKSSFFVTYDMLKN